MNQTLPPLALLLVALTPLTAQRSDVEFKWQKNQVVVSFGQVKLGKHSLDELPVGKDWRMGMNTASTLNTDLPLVGKDGLVAPGSYRVSLLRAGEKEFGLQVASSQLATAGKQAYFPTELQEGSKASKLELAWVKAPKGKKASPASAPKTGAPASQTETVDPIDGKHAQRQILRLNFGTYQLDMPIAMVAAKPAKVRGYKAVSFEWPEALFEQQSKKGHAIPVLTLRGKGGSKTRPAIFNLLVSEAKAELYPAMAAPTESFGFAGVKGFDADDIGRGKIEWSEAKKPAPVLTVSDIAVKKGQLHLTLAVGSRIAKISVPTPKRK